MAVVEWYLTDNSEFGFLLYSAVSSAESQLSQQLSHLLVACLLKMDFSMTLIDETGCLEALDLLRVSILENFYFHLLCSGCGSD